jgi:Short C-terminal domain
MRQLSPAGLQAISALAQRHGFGNDATISMLDAIVNGNGSMAQFNHPDFGGSGQWMRGGMIMISDMFNNYLKGRIDGLCNDLAGLVADQPDLLRSGSFQSQSQGGQTPATVQQPYYGGSQQQDSHGPVGPVSLFVPPPAGSSGDWWPADIGWPNSTGAQNNTRYAYFQQARRLAIEVNGTVTLYDTLDHQIGGFSQQQSSGGSLSFSSQYGLVSVASLPVILVNGVPQAVPPRQEPPPSFPPEIRDGDIFATIEKLAALRAKGILTDDEFATKKAELLSRL